MRSFALLCIDTATLRVRRYIRSQHAGSHRPWAVQEAVLDVDAGDEDIKLRLNDFRENGSSYQIELDQPEAA